MDKNKKSRVQIIIIAFLLLLALYYVFPAGVLKPEQIQLRAELEHLAPKQVANLAPLFNSYDKVCIMEAYADEKEVFENIDHSKFKSHFTGFFGLGYDTDTANVGLYLVKNGKAENYLDLIWDRSVEGRGCYATGDLCAKRYPKAANSRYEITLGSCKEMKEQELSSQKNN